MAEPAAQLGLASLPPGPPADGGEAGRSSEAGASRAATQVPGSSTSLPTPPPALAGPSQSPSEVPGAEQHVRREGVKESA